MSSLQERLRRLAGRGSGPASGRDGEVRAGGETAPAVGPDERPAGGAEKPADGPDPAADRRPPGAAEALPSFGRLEETEDGAFIVRERRYPLNYGHGLYVLADLSGRHVRLNRVSRRHAGIRPVAAVQDLLFFDAETTGLGVGAGNVPFLIGLGFYEGQAFVVRQLLVRDPGDEAAVLLHFRRFVRRFTHLVTYNGKSFDWPVLANRFVLHRIPPPEHRLEHLDLLPMSRNLWRRSLDSCRLSRVEEERLGIRREDDVPGHLAPVLYFQYLEDGDIGVLEPVFRHNEWDVLTLAALAIHLGAVLSGDAEWDRMEAEDLYRTGMWLLDSDLPDLAERPFAALLSRPEEAARYAARLAMAYKRMRRYDKAVPLWEKAAGPGTAGPRLAAGTESLEALVELAIYHEHRSGQLAEALRWTEEALDRVERLVSLHARMGGRADDARTWKAELVRRRNRLLGKLRGERAGKAGGAEPAGVGPTAAGPEQLELDWRI